MTSKRHTRGLVLGKFMPPHKGHMYLFDFARNYVDDLNIVVGTLKSEPIPGELRYQWVKELCPGDNVLHLTDENPQHPEEDPKFWEIWKESLTKILPEKPDYVFASEKYGEKLAEILGAKFIPVDLDRSNVPISGTAIRKDPMEHWEHIPRCVRPHYVRRICVLGPESTGKSTLVKQLSRYFNTTAVPEYARTLLEPKNGEIVSEDIPLIAKGQIASEEALARNANRLLICDTDLIATTIWSKWLFGNCPEWIEEKATEKKYDLYLLTDPNVPYVPDCVRYLPNQGQAFFEHCKKELEERGLPYVVIDGSWEERSQKAFKAVEKVLSGERTVEKKIDFIPANKIPQSSEREQGMAL